MEKVFINKEIEGINGTIAEHLIKEQNEMKFFKENIGINIVDKKRWDDAQYYEKKTWCNSGGKFCTEDRNNEHQKYYDNYKLLKTLLNHNIDIIELGCGPFTNLVKIIPLINKRIASIDLLDPLINDYMMLSPNCTYKNNTLGFQPVNTIHSPIETYNFNKKYDLVIMINVLEHCYNTDIIFDKIFNILKDDGILLIADKVIKNENIKEFVEDVYDAGHPIRISETYFNDKIKNYEILYKHEFIGDLETINKYFILRK